MAVARIGKRYSTLAKEARVGHPQDRLSVDERLVVFVVSRTSHCFRPQRRIELLHICRAELYVGRANILFQILNPLRARIGTMSLPLCSSHASAICPGVAPLRAATSRTIAAAAMLRSKFSPWKRGIAAMPEVAFRIFFRALHRSRQKSAAERREREQADAEFAQQRDDARLEIPLPEGFSLCRAVMGCVRCARRMVSSPASESPR